MIILLNLFISVAHAVELSPSERCQRIAEKSEKIMEARQNGIPKFFVMERVKLATVKEFVKVFMEDVVVTAYDTPQYDTDEMQQKSIHDFRDATYEKCTKTL